MPRLGEGAPQSGATVPGLNLAPTAVKTAAYNAVAGDLVACDTSGGIFTVTLPTAPADKTTIGVELVTAGNNLTVAAGGADVFNKAGGPTTVTLATALRAVVLQYKATGAIWYVLDHIPSVMTTKGDIEGYSTSRIRVPIGADGQVLTADSAQALGLKWAARTPELPMASGQMYAGRGVQSNIAFTNGNGIRGIPLKIDEATTFDRIGVFITSAGAATSVMRLGVWSMTNGLPDDLAPLLDAGTVDATLSNLQFAATIALTLQPGWYLPAMIVQVTGTPSVKGVASGNSWPLPRHTDGSDNSGWGSGSSPAGAFGSSQGGWFLKGNCPLVYLRKA